MSKLHELARLDGVAQAELIARGELQASDLLQAFAERLEAVNPLVRAVVAADLDRAAAARIEPGPFAGVPFLVKDSTAYPGLRWSMGARLFARNVARQRSAFTDRIDAGGLVVAGKTALSEFGLLASTETLLDGPVHNPWDLSRSAAGSSGGAAAAVAAGLVPLAHGNDAGGSIRMPASACGVFGFKPSRGRSVRASLPSELDDLVADHCLSRSVRDSALFLSLTEDREGALPPVGFVRTPLDRPLRIAAHARTPHGGEPELAVRRAHAEAIRLLETLGHRVEEVPAPAVDGAALGDALFLACASVVATVVGTVDRLRPVPVQRRELEPFTWAWVDELERRGPDALPWARGVFRDAAAQHLATLRGFDALLTPTLTAVPWPIGRLSPLVPREELVRRIGGAVGWTPLDNLAGTPAMSVPLHWTEDGLPVGAHLSAAPGADALLLGLAYQLEEARPWADRWAPFSCPRILGR